MCSRFLFFEDAVRLAAHRIIAVWKDDTEFEENREVIEVNPEFDINWSQILAKVGKKYHERTEL